MMEFACTQPEADAAAGSGDVAVEIVCNPNAYASAFAAKAMVTLRARGVKMTAEGALSALRQARPLCELFTFALIPCCAVWHALKKRACLLLLMLGCCTYVPACGRCAGLGGVQDGARVKPWMDDDA
jgi:hypothetical protein